MAFPAPSERFAFELGAGGSCYPRAPKGHAELGSVRLSTWVIKVHVNVFPVVPSVRSLYGAWRKPNITPRVLRVRSQEGYGAWKS